MKNRSGSKSRPIPYQRIENATNLYEQISLTIHNIYIYYNSCYIITPESIDNES